MSIGQMLRQWLIQIEYVAACHLFMHLYSSDLGGTILSSHVYRFRLRKRSPRGYTLTVHIKVMGTRTIPGMCREKVSTASPAYRDETSFVLSFDLVMTTTMESKAMAKDPMPLICLKHSVMQLQPPPIIAMITIRIRIHQRSLIVVETIGHLTDIDSVIEMEVRIVTNPRNSMSIDDAVQRRKTDDDIIDDLGRLLTQTLVRGTINEDNWKDRQSFIIVDLH